MLWEFLAAAKVQQKNETNKKISNKMVTNYKVPIIKIHSFTDSHIILCSSSVDNIINIILLYVFYEATRMCELVNL